MGALNVTFLSSRGRGMNPDLSFTKRYLTQNIENISFRYFITNELSSNNMVKKGVKKAKENFCRNMLHSISVDASLTKACVPDNPNSKRILMALPFDYQFKKFAEAADSTQINRLKTFQNFTHIMAPAPFSLEVLEKLYLMNGIKVIKGDVSPIAWDVNQTQRQIETRKRIEFNYPGAENKKIFSILTAGKPEERQANIFEKLDLNILFEQLGKDWFVFTNNEHILQKATMLSSKFVNLFGYVNQVFPENNLIYVSDVVVTNNSIFASRFASRRKPVYCIQYGLNGFEKYVRNVYPDSYIGAIDELLKKASYGEMFSEKEKRFCECLSYPVSANPCVTIQQIITDKN